MSDIGHILARELGAEQVILRGDERVSPTGVTQQCEIPGAVSALRERGRQELPEALRRARMR